MDEKLCPCGCGRVRAKKITIIKKIIIPERRVEQLLKYAEPKCRYRLAKQKKAEMELRRERARIGR